VAIATFIDVEFHKIGVRSSLFLTLSYLGVGVYSAARGNPLGVFYSLAQTPYLIGYFLLAGASIGALEASFTTRYGFIIGTFLELVTFSLALGYRFRLVEREKFNTQTDLLALQGNVNEQLKIQVDERTQELESATKELRSINSDYEALLQSVSVGVASIDMHGQKNFANINYQSLEKSISQLTQTINRHIGTESLSGTHELTIKGKNKVEHHLLLSTAERLATDGRQTGFWLVVTDVTDMRQKEASLNQAAKMATLGEMSTGMAHELNQPLNVIRLTMENVRRKLAQDDVQQEFLLSKFDRIDDQVTRASKLVSLMRTFGRVAPSAFEPFDLIESTFRAIDLMQEQLRLSQIKISADLPHSVPAIVNGSSSQYEQVLINLMSNARDAISLGSASGGTIDVGFKVEADVFVISVEDTGGGIAEDVIDRIFEPFFTTKSVGEGTGLGGAISYGIINDMNGTIGATNTNLGALFEIRLPKHHPLGDS
jgi:C4-dicarboxylate-specific signal transduction histidine kinase